MGETRFTSICAGQSGGQGRGRTADLPIFRRTAPAGALRSSSWAAVSEATVAVAVVEECRPRSRWTCSQGPRHGEAPVRLPGRGSNSATGAASVIAMRSGVVTSRHASQPVRSRKAFGHAPRDPDTPSASCSRSWPLTVTSNTAAACDTSGHSLRPSRVRSSALASPANAPVPGLAVS
jgi:hypothetical protein